MWLFCTGCDISICRICWLEKHKNTSTEKQHEVIPFQWKSQEVSQQMKSTTNTLKAEYQKTKDKIAEFSTISSELELIDEELRSNQKVLTTAADVSRSNEEIFIKLRDQKNKICRLQTEVLGQIEVVEVAQRNVVLAADFKAAKFEEKTVATESYLPLDESYLPLEGFQLNDFDEKWVTSMELGRSNVRNIYAEFSIGRFIVWLTKDNGYHWLQLFIYSDSQFSIMREVNVGQHVLAVAGYPLWCQPDLHLLKFVQNEFRIEIWNVVNGVKEKTFPINHVQLSEVEPEDVFMVSFQETIVVMQRSSLATCFLIYNDENYCSSFQLSFSITEAIDLSGACLKEKTLYVPNIAGEICIISIESQSYRVENVGVTMCCLSALEIWTRTDWIIIGSDLVEIYS